MLLFIAKTNHLHSILYDQKPIEPVPIYTLHELVSYDELRNLSENRYAKY